MNKGQLEEVVEVIEKAASKALCFAADFRKSEELLSGYIDGVRPDRGSFDGIALGLDGLLCLVRGRQPQGLTAIACVSWDEMGDTLRGTLLSTAKRNHGRDLGDWIEKGLSAIADVAELSFKELNEDREVSCFSTLLLFGLLSERLQQYGVALEGVLKHIQEE